MRKKDNTKKANRWLTLGANIGVLIGIFLLAYELAQNREAVQVMQKHGIEVIKPEKEDVEKFKNLSERAMRGLSSNIVSREVLNDVNGYLDQYRKAGK